MKAATRKAIDWIEDRTGFETALRDFLLEEIPASTGWPQIFGSIALFLFLTQALTGVLLAFNYAPTPGEAYNSIAYIMHQLIAGRMIRGLHHWGSSAMIIVVVIHMAQVFLYGAYKKPRETTWIFGVVLLLITLGFGLTGYLLPWDNRAYWGTTVTTQLLGEVPMLGRYLTELIGATNGIGAVTFTRFYALHTMILPAAMICGIAIHIYLVRRHGVTAAPSDTEPKRKFYPEQAFRDVVAVFIAFAALFAVAAIVDAPLEGVANATDTSYVPRPEWYFLFLFQTLTYFRGSLEPIGSVGLPSAAVLVLILVPFVDRGQLRRISQRTTAMGIVALVLLGWGGLTLQALANTPKSYSAGARGEKTGQRWSQFSPQELAGIGYFRQEHCGRCHNVVEGQPKAGPNLAGLKVHRTNDWTMEHFRSEGRLGAANNAGGQSTAELNALSVLVAKLTPEAATILEEVPGKVVDGAQIFVANRCDSCHKVNGAGGELGPPLNGLAGRRPKQWVEKHFLSPSSFSRGSVMPPYRFSSEAQEAIVSYLFSLPE